MFKVSNFKKIMVCVYPNSSEEKDLWKKIDAWEEVLGCGIRVGSIINIDIDKPGKGDFNWYCLEFPTYQAACHYYPSLHGGIVAQMDCELSFDKIVELLLDQDIDKLFDENPELMFRFKQEAKNTH